MARAIHKLKFRQVETLKKVGRHSDGGGLYLKITSDGSRRWVFMDFNDLLKARNLTFTEGAQ